MSLDNEVICIKHIPKKYPMVEGYLLFKTTSGVFNRLPF